MGQDFLDTQYTERIYIQYTCIFSVPIQKNDYTYTAMSCSKSVWLLSCHLTTVCPGSSDPFYVVTYYIKLVNTSWTHSLGTIIVAFPARSSTSNLF